MGTTKVAVTSTDQLINELASKCEHPILALWAADCAAGVLPYFEAHYADDHRPRMAVEAARAWVQGELKMADARKAAFAAHDAARAAASVTAACSAARAAGHAAATAHVATHTVHAAKYAAAAVRHATVMDAAVAYDNERNWQYQQLVALGKNH